MDIEQFKNEIATAHGFSCAEFVLGFQRAEAVLVVRGVRGDKWISGAARMPIVEFMLGPPEETRRLADSACRQGIANENEYEKQLARLKASIGKDEHNGA